MKDIKNRLIHDIIFVTPNGVTVKLTFEKEYRAFKDVGGRWVPMSLGGSNAERLREYIVKNF